jgi:hypothetical protein
MAGLRWLTRGKYLFHDTELSGAVEHAYHALAIDEHRPPFEPTLWYYKPKPSQHVEQVWFCGAHSDVGGGYAETGLSDIALDWMIERALGAGLSFDDTAIKAHPTHPRSDGVLHDSRTKFYRLTRRIHRKIGIMVEHSGGTEKDETDVRAADPTQRLHTSVIERWDADSSYRPSSLRSYFELAGDARAQG